MKGQGILQSPVPEWEPAQADGGWQQSDVEVGRCLVMGLPLCVCDFHYVIPERGGFLGPEVLSVCLLV